MDVKYEILRRTTGSKNTKKNIYIQVNILIFINYNIYPDFCQYKTHNFNCFFVEKQ